MNEATSGNPEGYKVLSEALRGNVSAQYQLALILEEDDDMELAKAWYRKAALQGHIDAAFRVGMLSLKDSKNPQSDAVYWLQRAAMAGHISASYNLAMIYESGKGVKFDPDEALRWHRIAAQKGHPVAKAKLQTINNWFSTTTV